MKSYFCLIKLILISKILCIEFLDNYKENQISCDKEFIILDSSGFKKGEKIFLEMEAKRFKKDFINYEFINDLSSYENITQIPFYKKDSKKHKYSSKTNNKREFDIPILVTKHFTIKKDNKGDYLVILFYCEGDVLIKNSEKGNKRDFLLNKIFICLFIFFLTLFYIFIILVRYKIGKGNTNSSDGNTNNNNNDKSGINDGNEIPSSTSNKDLQNIDSNDGSTNNNINIENINYKENINNNKYANNDFIYNKDKY